MRINVLLFGILKDILGRADESIVLPEEARVQDLLLLYAGRSPRFEAMVTSLAISVNKEYAVPDRALHEGDEVGLLPPVSGGLD